ncbi:MAG: tRNA glutamyl-Q(34) synthetase GluQRS [Wenzhouxiangella sp.]|nr:MAG: tRNA glutamyl-Q(34) synthetase GluQRS [Wenzhouxiangella sp.]
MKPSKKSAARIRYRGRFAPSPTGELHFGSLVAATGSFLQARASGGQWLIRIEDLDPPREVPGAADRQLETLAEFGLMSDLPVQRQSLFRARHDQALERLLQAGQAFPCACTRKDLPPDGIYPGTCRSGIAAGKTARSIRFRVTSERIRFSDALLGPQEQTPALQCGDFVIRRADGLVAYQLAVVVDDAAAGITQVVRGADLLDSTARQIMLAQALSLAAPEYLHLPLVVDQAGRKLSKSERDDPVRRYPPAAALRLALRALGHEPPPGIGSVEGQLAWATMSWNLAAVPHGPVSIDVHGSADRDYTPEGNADQSI